MVKSRAKSSRRSVKKSPARAAKHAAGKAKWVYAFGGGRADARAAMRNLVGGKGAGLAEMAHLGLPVPPGFTITTEVCGYFYQHGKTYPKTLQAQVEAALGEVGRIAGKKFGNAENPLLVSVRSGARASMPGMLDTVLNLGLNDATVEALAKKSGDRRFAQDSYRRFITMYSDVVLGIAHHHFEEILDDLKDRKGYTLDTDLDAGDLENVVARYKKRVEEETGQPFPQDPHSAANAPYPNICFANGCDIYLPGIGAKDIGLIWTTEPDVGKLAVAATPLDTYVLNLKLRDPEQAQAFASRYGPGLRGRAYRPRPGVPAPASRPDPSSSPGRTLPPQTGCWSATSRPSWCPAPRSWPARGRQRGGPGRRSAGGKHPAGRAAQGRGGHAPA